MSFSQQRKELVALMKSLKTIDSIGIENAFLNVPRELFFAKELLQNAYIDSAFPIGFGQTISQPSTIAIMLELLDLMPGQKVLEVGCGSGYVLALLSEVVKEKGMVYGIELVKELTEVSENNLKSFDKNVSKKIQVFQGNGKNGLKQFAKFDRILVSARCEKVPNALVEQLKENGKIVAPVGKLFSQEMVLFEKIKGKLVEKQKICCFVFVPLLG